MISIMTYQNREREYHATFVETVRTLNVSSPDMRDDCKPKLESTACMVWLDEEDTLCELEAIYPAEVADDRHLRSLKLQTIEAQPVLSVSDESKEVSIFREDGDIILFFSENGTPDKKYKQCGICYYVCGDELIAIECTNAEILL